ncbi:MAG TPA: alpha/beta hydrolase-fold protein [Chryseosolibacter sp.]
MKIKATLLAFLFVITQFSHAQKLSSGPQVLTFFSDADDTEQPYGLYLPKNYDENKKYPLVIMLHGAGSNHRLALRRVFGKSNSNGETDVEATRYFPEWKDIDYIVVSPYARGTAGYQGIPEKDVYDVLADVKKRFNIDEDRTYLTGLSMGGGGTLWIGMTRPDIWAAIAPVCPAPPQGTDLLIDNALNLPAHFYHGDKDQAVPVTVSRDWTAKLKAMGAHVEYDEYPGVNHDSWVNAYQDEAVFSWFDKFKRNRFPDRVTYNSNQYKYNKAYWVTFDKLIPGSLAKIDAKFTEPNKLEITTASLDAFTLTLQGHPKYESGKPLIVTLDGKKIKTQTSDIVSFSKKDGKWINTKWQGSADSKNEKLGGPIKEAFATRHIYVYGTAGNPTPEELKKRQDIATEAANWSFYRGAFLGRIMFFPRIVADKDVRPSDIESSNLILFGTSETNLLVDRYKDRLPLHLDNSKTSDHGLFYVYPIDGHYVAVNSGLPWWANSQGQNYRFPPSFNEVPNLKDFVLFKNSVKEVVVDGYFDDEWKLPAESKSKLMAGGAVGK